MKIHARATFPSLALAAALLAGPAAMAQVAPATPASQQASAPTPASGVQRAVVARGDVSVAGREAIVARIDVAAGASTGRHTHAGDEISYVEEGAVTVAIDGQPPRVFHAGEAFVIPAGTVHDARNESAAAAKLTGVFVVEKGKPLATPAPK